MLQKKWLRLLVALTIASMIAAACGGDDDDDDDASSDETTETTEAEAAASDRGNVDGELVIGALLPQSGDLSAIYDALSTPVDMAIEEINAAGGVNGTPVVRADADDGTSPDVAATGLDTLLNSDNVDVIVGPAASGVAVSLIDTVREAGVVQCSGSNTSAELSTVDDGGFYFRTAPPDALQGPRWPSSF